jgi:hypothetical protein
MTKWEVRLLMQRDAETPEDAVEEFISSIVDEGFRVFMFRVQDVDNDPQGDNYIFVQGDDTFTLAEAAERFGIEMPDDEDDEDDEDDDEDEGDPVPVGTDTTQTLDDDDSVISNVNE